MSEDSCPTSILSEDSDLASDIEADLEQFLEQNIPGQSDNLSIESFPLSYNNFSSFNRDAVRQPNDKPNFLFYIQESVFNEASRQLADSHAKSNCGLPCCLSYLYYIIIGTTNGFIFVFDRLQVLRLCINSAESPGIGPDCGPVTSISQNVTGSRLLASFGSGLIAMWRLPGLSERLSNEATSSEVSGASSITRGRQTVARTTGSSKREKKSANGTVQLFRVVEDAHTIGHSVIMCSFTTCPTSAVSVDTGGFAYELSFKRGIFGRSTKSTCFFSGSHGEICVMAPLLPSNSLELLKIMRKSTEINTSRSEKSSMVGLFNSAVVAMASFTKVMIITLKPRFCLSFWRHIKGQPSYLPQLAWSWCSPGCANRSSAILAYGRMSTIFLVRVTTTSLLTETPTCQVECNTPTDNAQGRVTLQCDLLRSLELDINLISLHCFSPDFLCALDIEEEMHVIDMSTDLIVETFNAAPAQLMYNSSSFKAVAIGGTVSDSMLSASERACACSVAQYNGQIILLGRYSPHVYSLRRWQERAGNFAKFGRFEEALRTCERFGLAQGLLSRCLNGKLTDVDMGIRAKVLAIVKSCSVGSATSLQRLSPTTVNLIVNICSALDAMSFLHSEIIAHLQNPVLREMFISALVTSLEALSPASRVPSSANVASLRNISPDLSMECLKWCLTNTQPVSLSNPSLFSASDSNLTPSELASKMPLESLDAARRRAEACLCRLSFDHLDIDRALKFCWGNSLYQGFTYIYSVILFDFESPFRILTDQLWKPNLKELPTQDVLDSTSTNSVTSCRSVVPSDTQPKHFINEIINTTLLFLRCSFAGEEIFGNPMSSETQEDASNKLFNLLLSDMISSNAQSSNGVLRKDGQSGSQTHYRFPRLYVLIRFAVVDLLNMLTLILHERFFRYPTEAGLLKRQRLFNALAITVLGGCSPTQISAEENTNLKCAFQIAHVIIFLSQHLLLPENFSIVFLNQKFLTLLETLLHLLEDVDVNGLCTLPPTLSSALFELYSAGRLLVNVDTLSLAQKTGLDEFCEKVYEREGDPLAVLSCLMSALQRECIRRGWSLDSSQDTTVRQSSVPSLTAGSEGTAEESINTKNRVFSFINSLLFGEAYESTGRKAEPVITKCLINAELLALADAPRFLLILVLCFGPCMRRIIQLLNSVWVGDFSGVSTMLTSASARSPQEKEPNILADNVGFSWRDPLHPAAHLLLDAYYKLRMSLASDLDMDLTLSALAHFPGDSKLRALFHELMTRVDPTVSECYAKALYSAGLRDKLREFLKANMEYRANVVFEFLDRDSYSLEIACIYEKIGDTVNAENLFEKDFMSHWNRFVECIDTRRGSESKIIDQVDCDSLWSSRKRSVYASTELWFSFCVRRSTDESLQSSQAPWFRIIDLFSNLRKKYTHPDVLSELDSHLHELLKIASPYVSIPSLISRVLKGVDNSVSSFGADTNTFMMRLVSLYQHEWRLFVNTLGLMQQDLNHHKRDLAVDFRRGVGLRAYSCDVCGDNFFSLTKRLHQEEDDLHSNSSQTRGIVAFWCGHGFHTSCLRACKEWLLRYSRYNTPECVHLSSQPSSPSTCPICSPDPDGIWQTLRPFLPHLRHPAATEAASKALVQFLPHQKNHFLLDSQDEIKMHLTATTLPISSFLKPQNSSNPFDEMGDD